MEWIRGRKAGGRTGSAEDARRIPLYNRVRRAAVAAAFFLMLLCIPAVNASAAAKEAPANVTALKIAQRGEASLLLQWPKAARAEQYVVYQVDNTTGKRTKVGSTTKTEYRIRDLEAGTVYSYQIRPYNRSNGNLQFSSKASNVVSGKVTGVKAPGAVSSLRITNYGDLRITLKWSAGKNATSYEIYMCESGAEEYKKAGTTTGTLYTVKNLTKGKTYKFKVRPVKTLYSQKGYGAFSEAVSGTAKSVTGMGRVHGRYYNAKLKSNTTVTLTDGKKMTLKKGASVVAKSRSTKNPVTIIISGRYMATISGTKLTYGNLYLSKTYYTKEQAEAFVNERGISSKTGSLIWISQFTCATYIFKGSQGEWKLVRSMPCVIGYKGHTPRREFTVIKTGWQYGYISLWFTWSTRLQAGYAFHRRTTPGVTRAAVSGGCIRMADADLLYMRNNCPIGTKILSY